MHLAARSEDYFAACALTFTEEMTPEGDLLASKNPKILKSKTVCGPQLGHGKDNDFPLNSDSVKSLASTPGET